MAKKPTVSVSPKREKRPAPGRPRPPGETAGYAALLVLAVFLAWSNSFTAPFVLDDHSSIIANSSIRNFWTFDWLFPPSTGGETVSGRPGLNLTFALNHAIGGLDVRGYHIVNVLVHALSAVVLFALVRFTFEGAAPRSDVDDPALRVRRATRFAFSAALLWALHPLHTGAVTYVVQRAESLAGLLYLLTLYAFARAARSGSPARGWEVVCVSACLLGMATKETLVTAPLVALLYDRCFVAGSFREAWAARRRLYAMLAGTWLLLAVLVWFNRGRGGSAGLGSPIDSWTYFQIQCEAILRYGSLSFWPVSQVFDYGVSPAPGLATWLPGLGLVAGIFGVTVALLWRNRVVGFLGACFLLLLAPSSSFIPVATQTIAEHRMYLPLAVLVVMVLLGAGEILRRWGAGKQAWAITPLLALLLGATTYARNEVYRSELTLWQDTVARRPLNPRARNNLGLAFANAGRLPEAIGEFQRAIELQPHHAFAHFNLGTIFLRERRFDAARGHFEQALAADPAYVSARLNLGRALTELNRKAEAIAHYRTALTQDPAAQDVRTNLAALLIEQGDVVEGQALLDVVLAATPDFAEAYYHRGLALEKAGAPTEAEAAFREAVRLKPELAGAHVAVGNSLVRKGATAAAEASYLEAIRRDPAFAEAHYALGNIAAKAQRFDAAMAAYHEALRIDPTHVQARNNLANCQLMSGRLVDAVASYEAVLRLRPGDETVQKNLEIARELLRQDPARSKGNR